MKGRIRANYLFAIIIGLLPFFAHGNNSRIDSLEIEFTRAKTPIDKVEILRTIFDEVQFTKPTKALEIVVEIDLLLDRARQNVGRMKIETLNLFGIAYMNLSQNDSALYYFQNTLEEAKRQNDSIFISKSYNNIGVINYY